MVSSTTDSMRPLVLVLRLVAGADRVRPLGLVAIPGGTRIGLRIGLACVVASAAAGLAVLDHLRTLAAADESDREHRCAERETEAADHDFAPPGAGAGGAAPPAGAAGAAPPGAAGARCASGRP